MNIKVKKLNVYHYQMGEYIILCNDTPYLKIDKHSFVVKGQPKRLFEHDYILTLIDSRGRNSLIVECNKENGIINIDDFEKIMVFILTNKVTTIKITKKDE